jgi:hypothetical protein
VISLEHQRTKKIPERGDSRLGANEVLVIRLKEGETYSRNCNDQRKVNAVSRSALLIPRNRPMRNWLAVRPTTSNKWVCHEQFQINAGPAV